MHPRTAPHPAALRAAAGWRRVHDVTGPLTDGRAPLGLYAHGAEPDGRVETGTGVRDSLVVPPRASADFGTYFNAFPAAQWRTRAAVGVVRLQVRVSAGAVLTVHRSDAEGAGSVVERRLLAADVAETVLVETGGAGAPGLVWFTLRAGAQPVRLLDAGWEVDVPARPGSVVIGTPTTGRVVDLAENLRRIAGAPALTAQLARIVVVDHAPRPVEAALREALPEGGPRLDVVRQANLGGAGGYSRVMHEAERQAGAAFALLLDDDVVVEPAALLRAVEFGRRATGGEMVGLQMLDAGRPAVLEAAAERIAERTLWWSAADERLAGLDVAADPASATPALHRMPAADFAGWWGALIPVDVVRAVGYAMPLFLKWDDAEYALRARRSGFETVSLQGAAVWHASWRDKDDSRGWGAFFHARNRLVVALLHGARTTRTPVLLSMLALEVKQLLALQTFAVERRQEGLRAVLAGPGALRGAPDAEVTRLLALSEGALDQQRVPLAVVDEEVVTAAPRALAPVAAPRGGRLAVWTALHVARHLFAPVRSREAVRLPSGRGTWWVLPSFDDVFTPTADGEAYFRVRRDPRAFRRLLATSLRLHLRLWSAWPALQRDYRGAAPELASPAAWQQRFDAASE